MILLALLASCSRDVYETGDSSLSYLKAEMVDMHVSGNLVTGIVTDADEKLSISADLMVSDKMARRDTTYRAMIYYNNVEPVELKSVRLANVLRPTDASGALTLANDPLKLISLWKSQNGRYINMSLGLMTGNADNDDAVQKISLVCDSVGVQDSARCYYLILHHDQDSIPQYYTRNVYLSIPIREYANGDHLCIKMNTYNGWIEKICIK